MKQRTANVVCLLLAVAGISFGVGQTVGQDRAEAGAQTARVQKVKDRETAKWARRSAFEQLETKFELKEANSTLNRIDDTLGARQGGKGVRSLLQRICANGTEYPNVYC